MILPPISGFYLPLCSPVHIHYHGLFCSSPTTRLHTHLLYRTILPAFPYYTAHLFTHVPPTAYTHFGTGLLQCFTTCKTGTVSLVLFILKQFTVMLCYPPLRPPCPTCLSTILLPCAPVPIHRHAHRTSGLCRSFWSYIHHACICLYTITIQCLPPAASCLIFWGYTPPPFWRPH